MCEKVSSPRGGVGLQLRGVEFDHRGHRVPVVVDRRIAAGTHVPNRFEQSKLVTAPNVASGLRGGARSGR